MENNKPLISVMILTYNHDKYVSQAVEGVLMQECGYDYEIVISDDFSTDNTREVCLALQKENPDKIRLLFSDSNRGVIENYISTMQQCKGKYIADCSGDDYWLTKDKLQKEIDILETKEDVVLVHTNWKDLISSTGEFVDDVKSRRPDWKPLILDRKDLTFYLNHRNLSLVNINTSCFRKDIALSIFDEHKEFFNKEIYSCEDFQLLFLMLTKGSFYYIDEEAAIYRLLDESVSQTCNLTRKFEYRYKLVRLRIALATKFNLSLTKYLGQESVTLLSLSLKTKRPDLAIKTNNMLDGFGYKLSPKTQLIYKLASNNISAKFISFLYVKLKNPKSDSQ